MSRAPVTDPNSEILVLSHDSQYTQVPPSSGSVTFPYDIGSPKPWRQDEKNDATSTPGSAANGQRSKFLDRARWSFSSVNRPPELRRFSPAWWKYYAKIQLGRKRFPRFLYLTFGFVLLVVWLGIASGFAADLLRAERNNRNVNINWGKPSRQFETNNLLLFLSGQISSFDPGKRTLSVGWSALIAQAPIPDLSKLSDRQVPVEQFGVSAIAIFRDTVARVDQDLINNGTAPPVYRLRSPSIKPIGFLGISDFDSISTDIGVGQRQTDITLQPEFGYPFDVFSGNITFIAANNGTIESSGRPGSGVIPMSGALLTDAILNFKVRTSTYSSCLDPNANGCELTISFWVERTALVKFCVFVVFFINWIITISIFLVTGEALLLNRQNILEGTDILAICFTALFALPSVRSLLPGVPASYGCLLDILGILPNVIIVTLCTTFFTNSRLRMRARKAAEDAEKAAAEGKGA